MTVDEHLPEAPLPEENPAAAFRPVTPGDTGTPETVVAQAVAVQTPRSDRSLTLFAAFLLIAAAALLGTFFSVHDRHPEELMKQSGSVRSHVVLTHWLSEGYFHYAGMVNRDPAAESIYLNSTGGYMVSGFAIEKLYSAISGHYSYRLLALHNQVVSMIISALAGLLSYRLVRRFGLDRRLAFTAGAAVVLVLFTFPDNLDLYWEMSAQAFGLLFALVYLAIEERCLDLPVRPRGALIAQAAAVFLMTVMESVFAMGFVAAVAATVAILRRDGTWKRFVLVVALPCLAAIVLYELQMKTAGALFPKAPTTGSRMLWRTGLDGDSMYYADHLDIAKRRDLARSNWPEPNRQSLFRWTWVFILGVLSILGIVIAFLRGLAPRFAIEALTWLTGAWLFYAAIFSQAIVIHPYLYDVLLFTPLCIALFALAPSLLESRTKETGAILLIILFSAVWYSLFQMRLYALRRPLPPVSVSTAAS